MGRKGGRGGSDGTASPLKIGSTGLDEKKDCDVPGYVIPNNLCLKSSSDQFRPIKPQNPPALQEKWECVGGKKWRVFATKKWFDTSFSAAVTKSKSGIFFAPAPETLKRKSGNDIPKLSIYIRGSVLRDLPVSMILKGCHSHDDNVVYRNRFKPIVQEGLPLPLQNLEFLVPPRFGMHTPKASIW
ncbi:hypothetical protein CEXT_39661 [Caerostris extrusa]|uniref:Uncharacterized protein n=1 Tax=Caerostris extrusa TaxID=172846 RepID=A0AAV4PYS6_CAEEX|nr:hypothetical protein CEXT_39661 [Caerostris extrusa]